MNRRPPRSILLTVVLLAIAPLTPARAFFTINTAASSWDPNFVYIRDTGLLLNVTVYATVWRGSLLVADGVFWITVPFDDFAVRALPGGPFLPGDIVRVFQFGNGVSCATLVAGGTLSLTPCPAVGGMRAYNNFDRRGAGLSWNGSWIDPNSYTNGVATSAYLFPLGTNDPNFTPNWIGPTSPSTGAPYTIHFDDYAAQPELWPLAAGGNTASLTQTRFTVCIERLRDPNQNPGDPNVYYAARTVRVNLVFFGNPQPTSPACPLCPAGGADGSQLVSVVHSGVAFDITAARSLSQFSCFRVTGTVPASAGVRIPAAGWIGQYHTSPSAPSTLQPGVGMRFAGGDLRPPGPAPAGRGAWAGPLTPALGLVGSSLNGIVYADPNSDPNDPNAAGWLFGGVGEPTLDANCPPPPSTIGAIWNNSAQTLYYYTSTPGIDDPLTHVLQTPRSLTVNACAGDIDGDGDTDQDDLDVVLFEFGLCPGDGAYSGLAKLADECDRCINQNDLDVILFEFGCAAGLALHGGDTPPQPEALGAATLGPVAGGGLGDGRHDPTRGRSAGRSTDVLNRTPALDAQDDIEITVLGEPIRIGSP